MYRPALSAAPPVGMRRPYAVERILGACIEDWGSLPLPQGRSTERSVGEIDVGGTALSAGAVVLGGAVIFGLGYIIYKSWQQQMAIERTIAEKEGATGLLKYHGGKAAVDVASSWLMPRDRAERNKPKRRARRKARR